MCFKMEATAYISHCHHLFQFLCIFFLMFNPFPVGLLLNTNMSAELCWEWVLGLIFRECSLFCVPVQTLETRVTSSPCHLAPLTLWCIMKQKLIQDIWVSILHKYCPCFFYLQCFNLYLCPTDSLTLEMDVASPMWSEKERYSSLGLRGN